MIITTISSWFCVASCAAFALFHASLALGAPLGEFILGGQYRILPKRMRPVSVAFVAYFSLMCLAFGALTGLFPARVPALPCLILAGIHTLFLGYAIYGNLAVTKSRKERLVMAPLSIIGFACGALVLAYRLRHPS